MVSSSPYHANLIILSWSTNSVRLVCRFDRHIDKDTHCFRSKYFFLSYEFWLELIKVYDYHTVLNSLRKILDIFCIHSERGPRLLLDYFHIYFYHWLKWKSCCNDIHAHLHNFYLRIQQSFFSSKFSLSVCIIMWEIRDGMHCYLF